jgi:TatD DNase family protein
MLLIDSHCHIGGKEFDSDRAEVIARARQAGVRAMLNVGTGEAASGNFERAVELGERESDVYTAIGIHPHDAKTFDAAAEQKLIALAESSKKVIAWGEIGLDFYYNHSPRDVQEIIFRRQIRIARELDLPIIIHSREADAETAAILIAECSGANFRGGIMHCFGGTPEMARQLIEIGFFISFAGNVTFKKADNLREAVRVVPLDRLLVETDAPYLAPVPFRGTRNEPARVADIARFLAAFYQIEFADLAQQTTDNFCRLFRLREF